MSSDVVLKLLFFKLKLSEEVTLFDLVFTYGFKTLDIDVFFTCLESSDVFFTCLESSDVVLKLFCIDIISVDVGLGSVFLKFESVFCLISFCNFFNKS